MMKVNGNQRSGLIFTVPPPPSITYPYHYHYLPSPLPLPTLTVTITITTRRANNIGRSEWNRVACNKPPRDPSQISFEGGRIQIPGQLIIVLLKSPLRGVAARKRSQDIRTRLSCEATEPRS
eukprot:1176351-Prorocentrum_minimum.AAC.3